MLRHVIAPARFFSQVPNEIIRHPRLSSDAVRLLTWQLSLPADAKESLSRTAERAGIGKCAFLRAKRELKAEGYLHEWREQGVRGLWTTVQLVSNVPLTAEEAAAARAPASVPVPVAVPVPAGGCPAAGEPTGRAVGRHPDTPVRENTSHHPAPPAATQAPHMPHVDSTPADAARLALARQVINSLGELDRRLRVPRSMLPQLAALAAEWLACGHTAVDVRECVRSALPGQGSPIRRPGGLVRYVLREVPPVVTPAAVSAPEPRIAGMRECEGRHDQAFLFRPVADERRCPDCRCTQATASAVHSSARSSADRVLTATRGAAAVRAALRERAALIAPRPRHSLSENPVN